MTKLFSSAIVFVASSAALAFPAIGDNAVMTGTISMGGAPSNFTLERTIKDFDASRDSFVIVETQSVAGQDQTITSITPSDELLSKEQVLQILSYCTSFGGVSELLTVRAGTFATCKLPTQDANGQVDGYAWIADVAFGIAKATGTSEGADYVLELSSFVNGN